MITQRRDLLSFCASIEADPRISRMKSFQQKHLLLTVLCPTRVMWLITCTRQIFGLLLDVCAFSMCVPAFSMRVPAFSMHVPAFSMHVLASSMRVLASSAELLPPTHPFCCWINHSLFRGSSVYPGPESNPYIKMCGALRDEKGLKY